MITQKKGISVLGFRCLRWWQWPQTLFPSPTESGSWTCMFMESILISSSLSSLFSFLNWQWSLFCSSFKARSTFLFLVKKNKWLDHRIFGPAVEECVHQLLVDNVYYVNIACLSMSTVAFVHCYDFSWSPLQLVSLVEVLSVTFFTNFFFVHTCRHILEEEDLEIAHLFPMSR